MKDSKQDRPHSAENCASCAMYEAMRSIAAKHDLNLPECVATLMSCAAGLVGGGLASGQFREGITDAAIECFRKDVTDKTRRMRLRSAKPEDCGHA